MVTVIYEDTTELRWPASISMAERFSNRYIGIQSIIMAAETVAHS